MQRCSAHPVLRSRPRRIGGERRRHATSGYGVEEVYEPPHRFERDTVARARLRLWARGDAFSKAPCARPEVVSGASPGTQAVTTAQASPTGV
jgi:hypothetical protein